MCFGEQFRNLPPKFGLFAQCVCLKRRKEDPKKCKPNLPRNNMTRSFGENNRRLVAITSASPKVVVRATKLWLVIHVGGGCEFHHQGEIGG